MGRTLVIAECGSSWDCDVEKAFRLINAAKACGADCAKFQWTSNAKAMAERRLGPNAAGPTQMYKRYLEYPLEVLMRLKAHCDSVGIEFMVTVYLIEDIAVIDPLVKRFKIAACESQWRQFIGLHGKKPRIVSFNSREEAGKVPEATHCLYCVSKYPTKLEDLHFAAQLATDDYEVFDGFSDHTANVLTGAAAVAAGATIIEAHIRLFDTNQDNPDFGHSLVADTDASFGFGRYVENIRTVERML